jgi:cleavage and polyadenylation specificity factor subunit 1
MFSISKQTHPATGIEHCLTCNFFHRQEKSLVVAGTNILRVFRLIPDIEPKKRYGEGRPPKMKLECMLSFTLWGNVASMESVSPAGSQRDALLLSFHDAKLSLVEYNPDTHDLRTLSLHYFEEEQIRGGWTHNEHKIPILRVDPEGRCAVMLGLYFMKIVLSNVP